MNKLIVIFQLLLSSFTLQGALLSNNEQSTCLPFPHFTWLAHPKAFKNVAEPICYEIQISSDAAFLKIVDQDKIYLNRYVPDRPLASGKFFWRKRSHGLK